MLPQDAEEAFRRTRRYMESKQFEMKPLPGLKQVLHDLEKQGVLSVLMTNSPEPCSRAILEKIGLQEAFRQYVFNANKPDHIDAHFRRFHESFGVPYESMASIGDHYPNEIVPAAELGMKTVHIDRYARHEGQPATIRLRHPAEIAGCLQKVLNSLAEV